MTSSLQLGEEVVRFEDVRVEYPDPAGPVHALDGVSHSFRSGSSSAVIGRSGSGKSTLVSVLALLRTPTAGDVVFEGRSTGRLSDAGRARLRRRIGIVFQSFHVDERSSVLDNVMFPYHWDSTVSRSAMRTRAMSALEMLRIADLSHRRVSAVSGGQRQRVAIARALAREPSLLIADEPTGNLDEATADQVAVDLFGACTAQGTTVVVVTHDPAVAALAGSRLHMHAGRLSGSEETG